MGTVSERIAGIDPAETRTFDPKRGWLDDVSLRDTGGFLLDQTTYSRSAAGRIASVRTRDDAGKFDYAYDYAGRLLRADNPADPAYTQSFAYGPAGSIPTLINQMMTGTGHFYYGQNTLEGHHRREILGKTLVELGVR